jgi:signal transduction histidine kinase
MPDPAGRLSRPKDARGRVVSIFAGAVLLPSIALSVVSVYSVPRQAEAMKITMFKRAESDLGHIEKELQTLSREQAQAVAREVGLERLLEGRPEAIRQAVAAAGYPGDMFESLRIEAASTYSRHPVRRDRDVEVLRDVLDLIGSEERATPGADAEDSVELTAGESEVLGTLRFRYSCRYARGPLLEQYFEQEWTNPEQTWVVRVAGPEGATLFETEPSPKGSFEAKRVMETPTFAGLKLMLRSRERSIEQEIERWKLAKIGLIAFIDLMLGAGLFLVYANVRREVHLSRLKSDFVANVSHELKTPLALIRLFAETLELGRAASEEKKQQYYRVINKESHRLTQLINNILDFSRIEAGRRDYHLAPAELRRVVEDVIEAYRFPIEQQGFELEVELADGLPELEVDEEALGQALINLINNAIKYSRDEKHIGISLRRDGERIRLEVRDRGIGIAKSEQKKIFEKFYRAEDSLVHTTKGSGLGLPLVRHIVEAHGGEIEVTSAPGKGSTFALLLPVKRRSGGARTT